MEAWILDHSPGNYRWGTVDLPALAPDEVRLRVVASALNHMDLWVTRGRPVPPLPHVPGCDVAGVVAEVGSEVVDIAVGDEVVINPGVSPIEDIIRLGDNSPLGPGFQIYGEHRWGGHATFAQAPARNVRPRPSGRSWAECAAFPLAHLTALRMLRRARLQAGETVLIVGIGSGVSTATLALARQRGARVVVTSRSASKRAEAIALGADEAFDSAEHRWPVRADVVVESVGPATWDASVRALAPGGRLVVCGGTTGQDVTVNLPRLFFRQHEIIGSTMGSYLEFDELLRLLHVSEPRLDVVIDREFPLADYPTALERLASGEQLGKIVLIHDQEHAP